LFFLQVFSVWDGIGCGANDVANSFATAVNSKTLTMIQVSALNFDASVARQPRKNLANLCPIFQLIIVLQPFCRQ
jgi:hypothetical protein